MTLSRAIGRASPPAASTAAHRTLARSPPRLRASSLRLPLAHARHFRSTPSAFYEDFDDSVNFLRQLQGAKKLKDQKKAQEDQKRAQEAQKRAQEAQKRKPQEDQALRDKQAREKREKFEQDKLHKEALRRARRERIDAESSRRTADQTEKYQRINNDIIAIRSEIVEIVNRHMDRLRRRLDGVDRAISDIRLEIHAIEARREAASQSLSSKIQMIREKMRQMFLAKYNTIWETYDRLLHTRRQLLYEADDIEKEVEYWKPRLAAAAAQKRLEARSDLYGWKAMTQRTSSGIWTTLHSYVPGVKSEVQSSTERFETVLKILRKDTPIFSPIFESDLPTTLFSPMYQILFDADEVYEQLLSEFDCLVCQSRRNFLTKWDEMALQYGKLATEVSEQMHNVDAALEKVYARTSDTMLIIYDKFEEFREGMKILDRDFSERKHYWTTLGKEDLKTLDEANSKTLHERVLKFRKERDWRIYEAYGQRPKDIWIGYEKIRTLIQVIFHLNADIQRDINILGQIDQLVVLFKHRDRNLETLRISCLMRPVEILSKRLTGFNKTRKVVLEDWYWNNREALFKELSRSEWKRRKKLMAKFKEATQDWRNVRADEFYDLYSEVKHVNEQLRGTKKLEDGRELIETRFMDLIFQEIEGNSFFDVISPAEGHPHVVWRFMRMWPERYFEAGMIGLKEQMKRLDTWRTRDRVPAATLYAVSRIQEILKEAERLAEKRKDAQHKWLKLASVYRKPRYDLDKSVVESNATAERSNHAYFSYELYRANSEMGKDEQESSPGPPQLRYHTTNATHSDVLRGLGGKFVGFDLRWKPEARVKDGPKANTSLLMIATDSTIHLLHLAQQWNVQPLITGEIKMLLESPDIFKVTVGSKEKIARLREFLGVEPQGFIDLEDLHYDLQAKARRTVSRSPLTLRDLVSEYLGYGLRPEAVNVTVDLALRLRRADQIAMGSNVYACFALWHTIHAEGHRKAEQAALLDKQQSAEQKRQRSVSSSPAPEREEFSIRRVEVPFSARASGIRLGTRSTKKEVGNKDQGRVETLEREDKKEFRIRRVEEPSSAQASFPRTHPRRAASARRALSPQTRIRRCKGA